MIFKLYHYSNAFLIRFTLLLEVKKAKREGKKVLEGIKRKIWKEPHIHEEYIWLYRFLEKDDKVRLIDVGGNSGYWSALFKEYFNVVHLFAFEPVKEMFQKYQNRYKDDTSVKVFNYAIGDKKKELQINVAANFGLTSFNSYDKALEDSNGQFTRKESVQVEQLDFFKNEIFKSNEPLKTVMKIDVQGFEDNVLKGGRGVLDKIDIIILECSFANEFKDKNPTFGFCAGILNEHELYPVNFGCFNYQKGPLAYERNALFVRKSLLTKIWGY